MTLAAKAIDLALAAGVSPLLKHHGFRKERRRYWLRTSTALLQVSVQASQWNHDLRARLTFNLGVSVPAVEALLARPEGASPSKRENITAGIRIGHLLPAPEDYWWELKPGESNTEAASSMRDAIANSALPWLNELATLEGLKRRAGEIPGIVNVPSLAAASAALLLGEESLASSIARQYIAHPAGSAEWGRRWASQNNVAVT